MFTSHLFVNVQNAWLMLKLLIKFLVRGNSLPYRVKCPALTCVAS